MESFGAVLRELTLKEYGSQRALARVVGLTPGRLSQIVTGLDPSLSYQTLELLLAAFPKPNEQRRLYDAWIVSYAPPPSPKDTEPLDVERFLEEAPHLFEQGQARTIIRAALPAWQELRQNEAQPELALRLGRVLVDAAYLLERRTAGLEFALEMEQIAKVAGDRLGLATALWLQGTGLQRFANRGAEFALDSYLRAEGVLGGLGDREGAVHLQRSLARDTGIVVSQEEGFPREAIEAALEKLRHSFEDADDGTALGLGEEITARLLTVLGQLDEADEALSRAEQHFAFSSPVQKVKIAQTRIRLALAKGDEAQAGDLLSEASVLADRFRLTHFQISLAALEADLMSRSKRPGFFSLG